MELLIITLVSSTLIASAFITTMLSVKIKKSIHIEKEFKESQHPKADNIEAMSTGYAYSVDTGDSMIIVVVMDKKSSSSNFIDAQPIPIKVRGIESTE